jgi:hypothetical protein
MAPESFQNAWLGDAITRIFHPADVERLRLVQLRLLSQGMPFAIDARIRPDKPTYRYESRLKTAIDQRFGIANRNRLSSLVRKNLRSAIL